MPMHPRDMKADSMRDTRETGIQETGVVAVSSPIVERLEKYAIKDSNYGNG